MAKRNVPSKRRHILVVNVRKIQEKKTATKTLYNHCVHIYLHSIRKNIEREREIFEKLTEILF